MTKSVDDYLAELRPYIDRWAIATQKEREIRRRRATPAELKTFYEAIVPNLEDIIEVLNLWPLNEMPDNARLLMNLTLSLAEIAPHVEFYDCDSAVPFAFEEARFVAARANAMQL